jgi:outer membrane protein TolC
LAAADRSLADALVAYAGASLGEALHESGRQLLALWFDWLNASSQVGLWQEQTRIAERQLDAVNARIRLGEAARAERVSAEAALAQARLRLQQASSGERQARARLQAAYPGIEVVAVDVLPAPSAPEGPVEAYVDAVLAHSHELLRARQKAEVLRAEAQQLAKRDGIDPNLGVFYRNEKGGDEQVLGLNLGLTLPGGARRSDRLAAEALAGAAQEAATRLEQRLRMEARAAFESARSQTASWQQAEQAARALAQAARLAERAYALGEGSFDQLLANRRMAVEGELSARQAQVEALAAQARLQLDAHRLWALDADEAADAVHAHP